MSAVSTRNSVKVNIKLNNGTDSDGKVQTLSVNLGKLSNDNYTDQKAWNVKSALEPCLDKPVYVVQKTEVSTLTEE